MAYILRSVPVVAWLYLSRYTPGLFVTIGFFSVTARNLIRSLTCSMGFKSGEHQYQQKSADFSWSQFRVSLIKWRLEVETGI